MTPVADLARRIIDAQGPISIAALMRLANTALPESYYQSQEPFGGQGDFVTGPEISQMFGEMLALALANQWQRMGAPTEVDVVELGPGRGVLMADLLRTWRQAAPGLLKAATITMIEASERLQEVQKRTLQAHADRITWTDSWPKKWSKSKRSILLAANEFFDAMPVQQFLRRPDGWRERLVNWDDERGFHDVLGPLITAEHEPEGNMWEFSPEAEEWMSQIAQRLAVGGGMALIIDYAGLAGETSLRGIAKHRKAPPLEGLGTVDLSAGVDFALLARESENQGAIAHGPVGQGPYLRRLGIEARHGQLVSKASKAQRRELDAALGRLIDADGMGEDFLVLAATGPNDPPPAAFPPPPIVLPPMERAEEPPEIAPEE